MHMAYKKKRMQHIQLLFVLRYRYRYVCQSISTHNTTRQTLLLPHTHKQRQKLQCAVIHEYRAFKYTIYNQHCVFRHYFDQLKHDACMTIEICLHICM